MKSENLLEDFNKTIHWISDNIKNEDNAYILIVWLEKMLQQLISNEKDLQELIKRQQEKSDK